MLGEPIWRNPHLYFQIGFCPEQDAFYERMTGLEWVRALVRLNGLSDKEADEAARKALTAVDLMEAADKKIGAYSKGMRQRVKMAQALVHDPQLLILDEPLSGMDPIGRRKTIRLIRDWGRAGKSIIVSSHILHEIESMTSNILLINNGRILAEGDVHQIRDLIDEHPHTVYVRAADPRRIAREFLNAAGRRRAEPEVRGGGRRGRDREAGRVLRAAHRDGRQRRVRRDRRGHVAGRQPAGRLPVPGEVGHGNRDSAASVPSRKRRASSPSAFRVFDLSVGEMLWSRRTIFMALVVGAPVLICAHSCACSTRSARPSSASTA